MKIEMLTLAAGPDGVRTPGQILELSRKEAEALIAEGYAREVPDEPVAGAEAEAPVEEQPAEETSRRSGRRG